MSRHTVVGLLSSALVAAAAFVAVPSAHAADRDCGDFDSQRSAQIFFLNAGGPNSDPHRLDSDGDGVACESNPPPYYYGTTAPSGGGGQSTPPQVTAVRSKVRLAVSKGVHIAGESYRMRIAVRPAISRTVLVQRKVAGRWKYFGKGTTSASGKTHGVFKAPESSERYRAVLRSMKQGNKKYSAAKSKSRRIAVKRQTVRLKFSASSVAEGDRVRASVRATPARAGRRVALQVKSGNGWSTMRTATFNRAGKVSLVVTPRLGTDSYRAVALRHQGAESASSQSRTLTAVDETPPAAPYDLVATAADGTVTLSWSRVAPKDFAHHDVYMRTADGAWSRVATTASDNVMISSLENDVTYWFAVTSVDTAGNNSAASEVVTATPTAPAPADPVRG